jgi:hypothetical protein
VFNYKRGKGGAEASWSRIKGYGPELHANIIAGAKREAAMRPKLEQLGKTPKMAQGWLNERRWEDEPPEPILPMTVADVRRVRQDQEAIAFLEGL